MRKRFVEFQFLFIFFSLHFLFMCGSKDLFFLVLQKSEKRRWLFRKTPNQETTAVSQQTPTKERNAQTNVNGGYSQDDHSAAEERHARAVEAAAEAAMASAQAAAEVARLIRPPTTNARHYYAAVVIQTAFRGYLVCKIRPFPL